MSNDTFLFDRLKALLPAQLEEVIQRFDVPAEYLSQNVSRVKTATELVALARQRNNGIAALQAIVDQVTGGQKSEIRRADTSSRPYQAPRWWATKKCCPPYIFAAILLLTFSGALIWWQWPAPEDPAWQQAKAFADLGDYAQAEMRYRGLLEKHPDDPQLQAQLNKFTEMQAVFRADSFDDPQLWRLEGLLQRYPDDPHVLTLVGHTRMRLAMRDGKPDWAAIEDFFQRALRQQPQLPDALFGLGNVALARKDYPQAEQMFAQAVAVAPDEVRYLDNLGFALMQQGRFAEAVEHFQHALSLAPETLLLYLEIAEAYRNQNKPRQASVWYRTLWDKMADPEVAGRAENQDIWWLGGEVYLRSWADKSAYVRKMMTEAV